MDGLERSHGRSVVTPAAAALALPEVSPGSIRYFVLLYCPTDRRRALATLLAVSDEIDVGRARTMEHAVAHLRLEWWRTELQRFARGAPQHPWLSAWLKERPDDCTLELVRLTEAAAIELATARLGTPSAGQLTGTLFVLSAQLLGVETLSGELEQQLRGLGSYVAALEQETVVAPPRAPEPGAQPRLSPLLVWTALAARQAARRARAASRFDMLADNFTAWSAARRAQRGRFACARAPQGNS